MECWGGYWSVRENLGAFGRVLERLGEFRGVIGRVLERLRKFCEFGRVVVCFGEFWSVSENGSGSILSGWKCFGAFMRVSQLLGEFCSVCASFGAVH